MSVTFLFFLHLKRDSSFFSIATTTSKWRNLRGREAFQQRGPSTQCQSERLLCFLCLQSLGQGSTCVSWGAHWS